jgi:hypothetical protein
MPGFMPGIHALLSRKDMDGRDKPGHDVGKKNGAGLLPRRCCLEIVETYWPTAFAFS